MKTSIEITGPNELLVNYDHSLVHSIPPLSLDVRFPIDFWGLILYDKPCKPFLISGNPTLRPLVTCICGWARIWFEKPTALEFEICVYANMEGNSFMRNEHGEDVRIERVLSKCPSSTDYEYHVGGLSLWPWGDANISIKTPGAVTLEYVDEDCMGPSDDEFECKRKEIILQAQTGWRM